MLMMHQRPTGKTRDEVGVIGNFVDLSFENERLYGIPTFDDTDDYAMRQYNKYENGTMRMVSAGLIPLKWGKDENGEVWLLESKLFEVSIADKGSNIDALPVALYTEKGTDLITLSSLNQIIENFNTDTHMKLITLSAGAVALGLSATLDTEDAVNAAINTLVQLNSEQSGTIQTLTSEKETAEGEAKTAKQDLVTLKAETTTKENKAFVALAHKQGKFVTADIPKYEKLMTEAPETGKEIIDAMPANKSVMEQLKAAEGAENPLVKLTYDELYTSGQLETLKADFPEVFKEKYKGKWNKEYQEN